MAQPEQQMEIGRVLTCTVNECSYNKNNVCHAPDINVGEMHPTCDTFTQEAVSPIAQGMPDVSVCNVTECRFNLNNDCTAPGITVAHHSEHADCLTYRTGV
ncbi:MAG: DUF1540 domain-containing protein [Actinomycetota bacterium]|nr:DUF1540 domain-containing protein [Actinomycetota bacterium]